jgi:hypothetical protein
VDDAQGDDDKEDNEHDNVMNESSFTKMLLNKSRKVLFKIRVNYILLTRIGILFLYCIVY